MRKFVMHYFVHIAVVRVGAVLFSVFSADKGCTETKKTPK